MRHKAPPADVLYNDGLRDYTAGKNDLALAGVHAVLAGICNTDLAGNAQFYLGEIAYRQGISTARSSIQQSAGQYPGGNKGAAAQLKERLRSAGVGQRDAGVQELRSLVSRYPKSPEALQARERLNKLGVAGAASRPTRPSPSHR